VAYQSLESNTFSVYNLTVLLPVLPGQTPNSLAKITQVRPTVRLDAFLRRIRQSSFSR